jgi:proline iminopeptidase
MAMQDQDDKKDNLHTVSWILLFFVSLSLALYYFFANPINRQINIFISLINGAKYIRLENGYHIWTKSIGNGPTPILVIHGGPGGDHEYLKILSKNIPLDKYRIIYYDQLGSYLSSRPDDPCLWNIPRFADEVEEVRKALKLDNFVLYGHSWGALLTIEYALKHSDHLKGAIISNTTASVASYTQYIQYLRSQLPPTVSELMSYYEERNDFSNPAYQEILVSDFYTRYVCRLEPWPRAVVKTINRQNEQVYLTIQGPNEFFVTGNMVNWDRWADLPKIGVPTLVIGARYGTMNPLDIVKMGSLIPNGTSFICPRGSHLAMYDDTQAYFGSIRLFLDTKIDQTKKS